MLRILCGEEPKDLLNTATRLFRSENVNDWFNDPIIEEIVLDVDETSHIHDKVFESPVLGTITADSLSGGVKGLILIMKSDYIENGVPMRSSIFGDNCVKWLIKFSFIYDFTIYMSHFLNFCFDDGTLDIDPRSIPINAIGRNGEKLSTCGEVIKYYLHIHAQEPDVRDLLDNETFKRVHLSPEDTIGTHEYYLARKDKCPYLTDATDPVTIKKMDILDKISHSKSEEELTQLREQLNALYRGSRMPEVSSHVVIKNMKGCSFEFDLNSKFTVILGNSGIGKSYLINTISRSGPYEKKYDRKYTAVIESDYDFCILRDEIIDFGYCNSWASYFDRSVERPLVFCCDIDFFYLYSQDFQTAAVKSPFKFLIVTRLPLLFIPKHLKELVTLKMIDNTIGFTSFTNIHRKIDKKCPSGIISKDEYTNLF